MAISLPNVTLTFSEDTTYRYIFDGIVTNANILILTVMQSGSRISNDPVLNFITTTQQNAFTGCFTPRNMGDDIVFIFNLQQLIRLLIGLLFL